MRVNRLEIQVADPGAALQWWRELLPDAQTLRGGGTSALVDAGGLELHMAAGDERGFGRLSVQVAPERLDRLAARHAKQVAVGNDGSRFFELEAPGGVEVRVFTAPEDDQYAE